MIPCFGLLICAFWHGCFAACYFVSLTGSETWILKLHIKVLLVCLFRCLKLRSPYFLLIRLSCSSVLLFVRPEVRLKHSSCLGEFCWCACFGAHGWNSHTSFWSDCPDACYIICLTWSEPSTLFVWQKVNLNTHVVQEDCTCVPVLVPKVQDIHTLLLTVEVSICVDFRIFIAAYLVVPMVELNWILD